VRPAILSACAALLLTACAARRGAPFEPPLELNEQQRRGQIVFMQHCNKCHPQGEGGLGPALNNKPLPGPAIRVQVRRGVGAMPKFSEAQIDDEDLSALSAYLLEVQAPLRGR
jgi:mono/diheme cytochrome c family protein